MNKKMLKICSIMILTIMMISVSLSVFAGDINPVDVPIDTTAGRDDIQGIGGKIAGALQVVGSVLAIIILIVLGIKYLMGSPEEKAEYKKTMIPWVIGAVLLIAAPTIALGIFNLVQDMA